MKARVTVITLGVDDLERSLVFYRGATDLTLGHIVRSQQGWGGYSGHFQDPDGHLWEIAWNPAWK